MTELQRLQIGIMIVAAIQGREPQEQVEILTGVIMHLVENTVPKEGDNNGA